MVKNLPAIWEARVQSLSWKDPCRERNDNPLQYSCLENSMDRGTWWATVIGLQRIGYNWVTNTHTHTHTRARDIAKRIETTKKVDIFPKSLISDKNDQHLYREYFKKRK